MDGCVERKGARSRLLWTLGLLSLAPTLRLAAVDLVDVATPARVDFVQSTGEVEVYDFVEITLRVMKPTARNPFTDVTVEGECFALDGSDLMRVEGFCDADDGSVFRLRFMPSTTGEYAYTVTYSQRGFQRYHVGDFRATDGSRRGPLRVDPEHPWHFVWEGTGEHCFLNGATAHYLLGWSDETMGDILERFHRFGVNRVRVLLYGRSHPRPWGTPVVPGPDFRPWLNPWPAARPDDVDDPGFDLSRFDVEYWRKVDRLLELARQRDIVVSLVFFLGGQVLATPFAPLSEDERRYLRYAVTRLAAFSNVTWDLGHEHDVHREYPDWADAVGYLIKAWDPWRHLVGAHNRAYRTRESGWADVQLLQRWDGGQNSFMTGERREQERSGRIVPQVNEGYGFEDQWEKYPGQRSAETRRRLAWEISMAGCYQTSGESPRQGTGVPPDTGGGWVNGRGDDTMRLFEGCAHMVKFFTRFHWWRGSPRNDLTARTAFCLASVGEFYALYLPSGRSASVRIEGEGYRALWYQPRLGEWLDLPPAVGPIWSTPVAPDEGDWAVLVIRESLLPDNEPPAVESVVATRSGEEIFVVFSEPVSAESAEERGNYLVRPAVKIRDAKLDVATRRVVTLSVRGLRSDETYTLKTWRVRDHSGRNAIGGPVDRTFRFVACPEPVLELHFDEGAGRQTRNTGSSAAAHPVATLTAGRPAWSAIVPTRLTGDAALDFGAAAGLHAVELGGGIPAELQGARSLTIVGWLSSRFRSGETTANCVVSTFGGGREGFELEVSPRGALRLGIGEAAGDSVARSRDERIPSSLEALQESWRFFAVTYDASKARDHVAFYTGTRTEPASLDSEVTYGRGAVFFGADSEVTVGHVGRKSRVLSVAPRGFRGIIDEFAIYASATDGTGALSLDQIRAVQRIDVR